MHTTRGMVAPYGWPETSLRGIGVHFRKGRIDCQQAIDGGRISSLPPWLGRHSLSSFGGEGRGGYEPGR